VWVSIAAGVVYILTQIAKFFSAESWKRRKQVAEAEREGREGVERERLEATYRRIDAEPPKSGQDLLDDLNRPRP
jgi:hypothetical protein